MSLDGAFLHIVRSEISERIPVGSRVDKIHQPSKDEIVLTFRVSGAYERLMLSANAAAARVCLLGAESVETLFPKESGQSAAKQPPMFCMTLRKHIGNGRLTAISGSGLERIVNFDFAASNEIGDTVNYRLIVEIIGRVSNIILVNFDTGKIIDSAKRVTDEISRTRRVLPNLDYEPPARDSTRHCLLDCDIDGMDWALDDKVLLKQLEGVSPIFVREAVYRADGSVEKLRDFLREAKAAVTGGEKTITLVSDLEGKPRDFCFMPIAQYGSAMNTSLCESANALLDGFFKEKAGIERLKQRSGNIMKTLNTAYERLLRKIGNRKLELAECENRDTLRVYGDLINANIYRLQKGDTVLEAENYVTGGTEKIALDVRLTPAQNAQKYYAAYRKLNTAEKMLTELIAEGERELLYLDSVIDAAGRATSDAEISAIRAELKGVPDCGRFSKKQKQQKPLQPLKFAAADGTEILVGRNNSQNDELTFKIAKPHDIWLHTKDIAGSHVILRCSAANAKSNANADMEEIPAETITEAAVIAARHSKGRESGRVPVDYTFAKFVKKPSGAKPGFVIFTNNRTVWVNPIE